MTSAYQWIRSKLPDGTESTLRHNKTTNDVDWQWKCEGSPFGPGNRKHLYIPGQLIDNPDGEGLPSFVPLKASDLALFFEIQSYRKSILSSWPPKSWKRGSKKKNDDGLTAVQRAKNQYGDYTFLFGKPYIFEYLDSSNNGSITKDNRKYIGKNVNGMFMPDIGQSFVS